MKKVLGIAAAAFTLTIALADANAWERKTTTTGPQGNSRSVEASGKCTGNSCTYKRVVTTPSGEKRVIKRKVVTGPNGKTVSYGAAGRCSGDSCSYAGGAVGPNGGVVTGSGTVKRH